MKISTRLKNFVYLIIVSITALAISAVYAKDRHHSNKGNIQGTKYICEENKFFYLDGLAQTDNNLNLYYNKVNLILSRVDTQTGAGRFTNLDKGFDLVILPTKLMLMDTKLGRRIADNCLAEQANITQLHTPNVIQPITQIQSVH